MMYGFSEQVIWLHYFCIQFTNIPYSYPFEYLELFYYMQRFVRLCLVKTSDLDQLIIIKVALPLYPVVGMET